MRARRWIVKDSTRTLLRKSSVEARASRAAAPYIMSISYMRCLPASARSLFVSVGLVAGFFGMGILLWEEPPSCPFPAAVRPATRRRDSYHPKIFLLGGYLFKVTKVVLPAHADPE